MSKITVVQIAYMGDDYPTEYLDDKGRIWFENYVKDNGVVPGHKDNGVVPGHYEWICKSLPDEPAAAQKAVE